MYEVQFAASLLKMIPAHFAATANKCISHGNGPALASLCFNVGLPSELEACERLFKRYESFQTRLPEAHVIICGRKEICEAFGLH